MQMCRQFHRQSRSYGLRAWRDVLLSRTRFWYDKCSPVDSSHANNYDWRESRRLYQYTNGHYLTERWLSAAPPRRIPIPNKESHHAQETAQIRAPLKVPKSKYAVENSDDVGASDDEEKGQEDFDAFWERLCKERCKLRIPCPPKLHARDTRVWEEGDRTISWASTLLPILEESPLVFQFLSETSSRWKRFSDASKCNSTPWDWWTMDCIQINLSSGQLFTLGRKYVDELRYSVLNTFDFYSTLSPLSVLLPSGRNTMRFSNICCRFSVYSRFFSDIKTRRIERMPSRLTKIVLLQRESAQLLEHRLKEDQIQW